MTENQAKKIDALIASLPQGDRQIYREIAEYAVVLGYMPSQVKNVHGLTASVVFAKSKVGHRLCKISPPSAAKGKELYNTGKTLFALSFFATTAYSALFHEGVKQEFETLTRNYKGCSECKGCTGGYTYQYPNGRQATCCSGKLIELSPVHAEHLDEIKRMMKAQDVFWLKQNTITNI